MPKLLNRPAVAAAKAAVVTRIKNPKGNQEN